MNNRHQGVYPDHQSDDLYQHTFTLISGEEFELSQVRNHVLLVVNTASHCGFTPQYRQLEELHQKYRQHNFTLIGCPCDQFGGQEFETHAEISAFCHQNFNISFLLTQKLNVNGRHAHPLFRELKKRARGFLGTRQIKWNFTKFLIAPDAAQIIRYGPHKPPIRIESDLQYLIHSP